MPSRFERKPEVGFVASPTSGGFVPQGGSTSGAPGHRQGGFGQGGDSRYIDGHATGHGCRRGNTCWRTDGGWIDGQRSRPRETGCQPGNRLLTSGRIPWTQLGLARRDTACHGDCSTDSRGLAARSVDHSARSWRSDSRPIVVLVEGRMVDEIDEFVSKIWDRIEDWGIAVAGGYWKPVLHMSRGPGRR